MSEPKDSYFHFIVRFQPKAGKADAFKEIMVSTAVLSRAEDTCLSVDLFESIHEPKEFSLHSVWVDEAAFEVHSSLPHTERFIEASKDLLTHELKGLRLHKIG